MFSKIIFVLGTVCIVNASVLTLNVFDDDPETEVASNPKDCNVQACDQLCRRLKLRGGVCVNGRCKCDNFLNAEDEVSEKTLSDLEDSVLQTDDPEAEIPAKWSKKCNLPACDLVCRWVKKTSGSCVNDRCTCAKSLVAEDEAEVATSQKKCIFRACYSQCRSGNYISGACVKGRCKCYNSTNKKDEVPEKSLSNLEDSASQQDDPETEIENKTSDCNNQACDQSCRRLKLRGGICVNGRCKCDNFLSAEDQVSEKTLSDLADPVLQTDDPEAEIPAKWSKKCNLPACDLVCSWVKKTSGSCVNDRCTCAKSLVAEDDMTDPAEFLSPSSCNFRACDQQCFRFGHSGGTCVNGRCKCNNFLNAEDQVSEKTLSDLEDPVLQTDDPEAEIPAKWSKKCNLPACDLVCSWLKKTSGSCVNDRCTCAKSLVAEDDMTDPAEFLSPSSCNFRACDQQCFRFGHSGGTCVNGRCKCNIFLNTEDAVSEPNIEDSVSSRACNNNKCNQLCRKQKFRGGACLGANCYCNKFYSLLEDTMTDSAESLPLSSCNSVACNDQCQRNGWHSGVCVNGQCKCDYFLNTQVSENSISNLEDSVSRKKCNHQECNAECRKLFFREGVCIAGHCSCNNYFPTRKDAMNDLTESITIDDNFLSTEDAVDEYSELAPRRACRLTKCNRKCIRGGYAGATCVNGHCKCYNNLQEKEELIVPSRSA